MGLFFMIWLALVVIVAAGFWKAFEKAGQPGWACIVPIYNIYTMTKIGGKPGYWTLLMFIPIVNIIFYIWLLNMISKSFGQTEGFTVGLVLLGIVFWPILGFSKEIRYIGPYGDPAAFAATQDANKFDFERK